MAEITFEDLKALVLQRLNQWITQLGPGEAQLPRQIIRGRPFSPLDMRREVEMGTEIGVEIISMEARKLGYAVG